MRRLEQAWYRPNDWLSWLLLPLSALFCWLVTRRRANYQRQAGDKFTLPVIVVGNITVGGTGKTPLVLWLVSFLKRQGWRPAIISRGYGGACQQFPHRVSQLDSAAFVGDEPRLMANQHDLVVIDPKRRRSSEWLLRNGLCDIIICDDGLQHYALSRDIEIVMLDGKRRLGNERCLPAGPLREPAKRLDSVDFVLVSHTQPQAGELSVQRHIRQAINLHTGQHKPLNEFSTVFAVAGIGNPQAFFSALTALGVHVIEKPFADHHPFQASDFAFAEDYPILMTEKDAVKCQSFATAQHWWVPLAVEPQAEFVQAFQQRLTEVTRG